MALFRQIYASMISGMVTNQIFSISYIIIAFAKQHCNERFSRREIHAVSMVRVAVLLFFFLFLFIKTKNITIRFTLNCIL